MEQSLEEVKRENTFEKEIVYKPEIKKNIKENNKKDWPIWFKWIILIFGIVIIGLFLYIKLFY
jgi:transposase